MMFTCPGCGYPVNSTNIEGRYLRCPQCGNTYLCNTTESKEITEQYYSYESTLEEDIEKCFNNIIQNTDIGIVKQISACDNGLIYLPFVETVDNKQQLKLVNISLNNPTSITEITDLTSFENEKSQSVPQSDIGHIEKYDKQELETLGNNYQHVGSKIKYIPVRYFTFNMSGNQCKYVLYGGNGFMIEGDSSLLESIESEKKQTALSIYNFFLWLFTILMIITAWYKFCYTYYHFNGLLNMFIYANGYKCVFPFVGISIIIVLGQYYLYGFGEFLLTSIRKRKDGLLQTEIREILIKKFSK